MYILPYYMALKLQLCSLSPAGLKAKFLRYLLSVEGNVFKSMRKKLLGACVIIVHKPCIALIQTIIS